MATFSLIAALPNIDIEAGMMLRLNAISPTTGAEVSGVTASHWAIYGDETSGAGSQLADSDVTWVWGDSSPLEAT